MSKEASKHDGFGEELDLLLQRNPDSLLDEASKLAFEQSIPFEQALNYLLSRQTKQAAAMDAAALKVDI